jgi:predicted DNA-binding protein (MmcQ/YjbR family)
MDAERIRAMLLELPHVAETMQWGANLVFWVGDKAIGGKMFAVVDLDGKGGPVISYAAGPERFAELVEQEDIRPAPYLARAHWVAVERWGVFRASEWKSELEAAHGIVFAKMPKRTRDVLAMPAGERRRLISTRKALLAKQTDVKR